MPFQTPPIPLGDPIADRQGFMTQPWVDWFNPFLQGVDAAPAREDSANLTEQSASIGATAIGPALPSGLYRVSWYARITRAATVNSSLTVTIGWQESAVVLSSSGAAMTGNTTATVQSGSLLIRIDGGSLTYATTYASAGATTMQYRLDVLIEQLMA